MYKKIKVTVFIIMAFLISGCVSQDEGKSQIDDSVITGLDNLIDAIAANAVEILPAEVESNLAIYYFTSAGRESSLSDYLINGLTTEMANRVPSGYNVVSRKGLDRIMEEYSFQLSDLVSEETQVDIGELLGADTIITGFITEKSDRNHINIQILDIHTGAVTGGFTLDFIVDEEFDHSGSSEVITMERQYVETVGVATTTIIHDTFDGPIAEVSPGYFEEHWGERILDLSGNSGIDPQGFAYLDFSAQFDSNDHIDGWEDSDLTFYMDLPLGAEAGDSDGIYLKILPQDFSQVYLFVKQEEESDPTIFGSPVSLTPGQWNELRVPYANLNHVNGSEKLSKEREVTISIGIPYMENVMQNHFPGKELKSRLSVDEVGLYQLKSKEESRGVSFEDEISRALASAYYEGVYLYTDYMTSDSGIQRKNGFVESSSLLLELCDDGPVGRYLCLKGTLSFKGGVEDFLSTGGELYIILNLLFSGQPENSDSLTFLYSSDLLSKGFLYLSNPRDESAFESDFSGGNSWSRVSIAYRNRLYGEENTGMAKSDPLKLSLMWQINESDLKSYGLSGSPLEFAINIDELMWE